MFFFGGAPPRRRKMLRLRARGGGEFRAPERELLLSPATKVTKSAT